MSRTIGRKWPRTAPRGDFVATCSYCGVPYRRSQLVRLRNGHFACVGPGTNNDGKGRDEVTLNEMNAAAAGRRAPLPTPDAPLADSRPDDLP